MDFGGLVMGDSYEKGFRCRRLDGDVDSLVVEHGIMAKIDGIRMGIWCCGFVKV